MTSVVVTLPSFSAYIKAENDDFLIAENLDYLITEDQPGVQSVVLLNGVFVEANADSFPSGLQANFSTGTVFVTGEVVAFVAGVQSIGLIGTVNVWGPVNTSQIANWTPITNSTNTWSQIPT